MDPLRIDGETLPSYFVFAVKTIALRKARLVEVESSKLLELQDSNSSPAAAAVTSHIFLSWTVVSNNKLTGNEFELVYPH